VKVVIERERDEKGHWPGLKGRNWDTRFWFGKRAS